MDDFIQFSLHVFKMAVAFRAVSNSAINLACKVTHGMNNCVFLTIHFVVIFFFVVSKLVVHLIVRVCRGIEPRLGWFS